MSSEHTTAPEGITRHSGFVCGRYVARCEPNATTALLLTFKIVTQVHS